MLGKLFLQKQHTTSIETITRYTITGLYNIYTITGLYNMHHTITGLLEVSYFVLTAVKLY